ncbi:molybdenum cofactor guanylyltransferase MobA [Sulfurovum sp.]|uniref:molybdenum cofactor guanylyltransferase MobA n=1 Tax=Sulfurovum sp. TaxID=1969726 RepID=UPI002867B6FC|nr:molybdenum cofactor guanylyltransferase MobA [Sulfurovum sp.]
MMPSMPAVIFAGGKSSRMGKDKALLPFGSYPTLTEFQHAKLSTLFQKVYISAKTNKFHFACNVIEDTQQESSPLVGIVSIFETLNVEEVFILSVDVPFVEKNIVGEILKYAQTSNDAIVAQSPSGIQPLCGLYRKSILPFAQKQLENHNHKLHDLLSMADTLFVPFDVDEPFTNLNHPQEYEKALKRF